MHKDSPNIRFECLKDCSRCCELSGGFVFLTDEEAAAIAAHLDAPPDLFLEWFTRDVDGRLALVDGPDENCVFLEDGVCSVYAVRPKQCRTYPFWPENMRTPAHWKLTTEMCPGLGKGRQFSAHEIKEIIAGKDLDSER